MENASDSSITVEAAGRVWTLRRPADLETLWADLDNEAASEDERLPYWVELWPSSLVLGEWLLARAPEIKDRLCLDLGCGLGLTAMIARSLGARVLAVDYEIHALRYVGRNAAINSSPAPFRAVMDWRFPALKQKSCAFIWGGDIMYERRFVAPVLDFLDYALARQGLAWIAEPDRSVYEAFRAALTRRGWTSRRVRSCLADPLYEQEKKVSVSIWELSR